MADNARIGGAHFEIGADTSSIQSSVKAAEAQVSTSSKKMAEDFRQATASMEQSATSAAAANLNLGSSVKVIGTSAAATGGSFSTAAGGIARFAAVASRALGVIGVFTTLLAGAGTALVSLYNQLTRNERAMSSFKDRMKEISALPVQDRIKELSKELDGLQKKTTNRSGFFDEWFGEDAYQLSWKFRMVAEDIRTLQDAQDKSDAAARKRDEEATKRESQKAAYDRTGELLSRADEQYAKELSDRERLIFESTQREYRLRIELSKETNEYNIRLIQQMIDSEIRQRKAAIKKLNDENEQDSHNKRMAMIKAENDERLRGAREYLRELEQASQLQQQQISGIGSNNATRSLRRIDRGIRSVRGRID